MWCNNQLNVAKVSDVSHSDNTCMLDRDMHACFNVMFLLKTVQIKTGDKYCKRLVMNVVQGWW